MLYQEDRYLLTQPDLREVSLEVLNSPITYKQTSKQYCSLTISLFLVVDLIYS